MRTDKNGQMYDPEIQFRVSDKIEGHFYVYVDDYVLNQLKDFTAAAEAALIQAKTLSPGEERVSVGPINMNILNDEDRDFYVTKRKYRRAPDATLKFRLPKAATSNTEF